MGDKDFEQWWNKNQKSFDWSIQKEIAYAAWKAGQQQPNPHSALIAQCEQDKIDYPDFYEQLYQFKSPNGWETLDRMFNAPFLPQIEHRVHPHRESIIKWHGCSNADKLRWEYQWKDTKWVDNWITCRSQEWSEKYNYRLRHRTCKVTLENGDVLEYPEPCREPLENGKRYWVAASSTKAVFFDTWNGHIEDYNRTECGSIHLTEQAANQHLSVLQAVNAQVSE